MKLNFYILLLFFCSIATISWGRNASPTTSLIVLQLNIWHEGTIVEGGFEAIANEIVQVDADVVFFSEIRNYKDTKFILRITDALKKRGKVYYGEHNPVDVGILSKYKIEHQEVVYPQEKGYGSIVRATFHVAGHTVAAYSAHLDYKNYACYLPRGYDGATWKKMEKPVCNADSILTANRISLRKEAIEVFIQKAKQDIKEKTIILLGGDFNEPSHLDWQKDTKHLWDHNGMVVNWDCSRMLYKKGFKDVYRMLHPNPVTHPGFTFPSDNNKAPVSKLTWAPDADERDRIDFIYYYPNKRLTPVSTAILGPSRSIIKGERSEENTQDRFITPKGVWPSDHKGVVATFTLSEK